MPEQPQSNAGKIRKAIRDNPSMSNREIQSVVGKCCHSFGGTKGTAGEFFSLLPIAYVSQVRRQMKNAPADPKPACKNCAFWEYSIYEEDGETSMGDCRAMPPNFSPDQTKIDYQGCWPHTNPEDWCGRFRQKGVDEESR